MIEIREVSSKKDLKKFVNFTLNLYENHPNFVPNLKFDDLNVLREDKNPAFENCEAKYWLAYKDNEIVGKIAAIINYEYIKKWGKEHGRFGFVDFIEDFKVAEILFKTAENWLKSKGMKGVQGPLGFCDLDPEGLLIEGFEEMGTFTTIYNFPYYPLFIEKLGYEKEVDWYEYKIEVPKYVPENIKRISQRALEKYNVRLVEMKNKKQLLSYAPAIFELLNLAYEDLYGVVPLSQSQIDYYTKQYFDFVDPDFIKIIVDNDNNLVSFGIAIPSLAKALQKSKGKLLPIGVFHLIKAMKINKEVDLLLIAVQPDYQGKGINTLLLNEFVTLCNERGIKLAHLNPQLESNINVRGQWKYFNPKQHKKRRCYIKEL